MAVRLLSVARSRAYLLTLLATAIAVFVRWLADPWLGDTAPLVTLYGAVAIVVAYGGSRPAAVSATLGYLACNFAFVEPRGAIAVHGVRGVEGLALYALTCSIIVGVGQAMRIARRSAEEHWQYALVKQNELQAEVGRRRQAELALRRADRNKDEFLAMLAHELRNPLAAATCALELLRLTHANGDLADEALATVQRQVTHLSRLAADLADLARIANGRIELRRQRLELTSLCHHAVETVRPLIDAMSHELVVTAPAGPIYVDVDPVRMTQVLSNLLANAAKYTPQGGRVWLSLASRGGEAIVIVRDTGVGIPETMLSRVFDVFSQLDSTRTRSQGGLGLGLALAKRLTELHGGQIAAKSDGPGKGSEFTVRLPLAAAPLMDHSPRDGNESEPSEPLGGREAEQDTRSFAEP